MDNAEKFTFGVVALILIISILAFWDFAGVIIVAGSLAVVLMPGYRIMISNSITGGGVRML